MRNPLRKRIFREIKAEAGKYIVIFLFMTALVGIVSGFLIADESLQKAYDESPITYNAEDGNLTLAEQADDDTIATIEEEGVTLYENFYTEQKTDDFESTVRLFANRETVNKASIWEGSLPAEADEIALDRVYATNHDLSVGDRISINGNSLQIVGIVALPDYSALFQNNTDFVFDSIRFGVALMTQDGLNKMDCEKWVYCYAWKYDNPPADALGAEAKEMGDDFLSAISTKVNLTNFIPRYASNAMNFAGSDLGGDRVMFLVMMYLLIVIIAFVFAITTSNTISREANVIGTLRASGYSKGELIRHYMTAPILVLLFAAIVGNVLGYTLFRTTMAGLYLGSYGLPTYHTLWNATAFIETTIVPMAMMILINFVMLARMMQLSPLQFIRRDLKRRQKKKAFQLNTKINIMTRFRLRVIFQNIPNYITIFVGVLFAGVILVFGTMLTPLLDYVEEETIANMTATHQYILTMPVETETADAEKFCVGSLKTTGNALTESISIYGVVDDSRYVHADVSGDTVYISSAYADKYSLKKGDHITLKEEFGEETYTLSVDGIYENPTTLAVFLSQSHFNEMMGKDSDYYSGYLSDTGITDIDDALIATEITESDYTKSSRQLKQSMGNMIVVFWLLGVAVFMLVIYLLAKIIIEKNAQSISMSKILGYQKREINQIYIHTTTFVTILSLLIALPLVHLLINWIWHEMMTQYTGWIPCVVLPSIYGKVILIGVATYAVVAALLMRQTNKIPLADALKNVE